MTTITDDYVQHVYDNLGRDYDERMLEFELRNTVSPDVPTNLAAAYGLPTIPLAAGTAIDMSGMTYADAEKFAAAHNLELNVYTRRDGEQWWRYAIEADGPITSTLYWRMTDGDGEDGLDIIRDTSDIANEYDWREDVIRSDHEEDTDGGAALAADLAALAAKKAKAAALAAENKGTDNVVIIDTEGNIIEARHATRVMLDNYDGKSSIIAAALPALDQDDWQHPQAAVMYYAGYDCYEGEIDTGEAIGKVMKGDSGIDGDNIGTSTSPALAEKMYDSKCAELAEQQEDWDKKKAKERTAIEQRLAAAREAGDEAAEEAAQSELETLDESQAACTITYVVSTNKACTACPGLIDEYDNFSVYHVEDK